MIYFFFGPNTDSARARAKSVISAMKKKRPGAEYFRITSDKWNEADFEQFAGGQGLFDRKFIVFADGIFASEDAKTWIADNLDTLKKSESGFVFLEDEVETPLLEKVKKAAQEVKKFDAVASVKLHARRFNTFRVADALGEKSRKKLWITLCEAFMEGVSPEEINGVLFWQVKSMLMAISSRDASEAGLKPFVYLKSKRYAENFGREKLLSLSREFIKMYHDAHRGLRDFPTALESFTLLL